MATYANEGIVTADIPCIRAFPERVAFGSLSTELGDVKICLNPLKKNINVRQGREEEQYVLPRPRDGSEITLSKDVRDHRPHPYKGEWAIGPQPLSSGRSEAFPLPCNQISSKPKLILIIELNTYSSFDQSRLAGQRSPPVRS